MQLGGQPEAQGGLVWAPGFDWRRERVPAEAVALVEAKQAAHYWRSMHARAKARVAQRWGQWRAAERQLADARRQIAQLAGRVRELEQENAGLRQRQQELLKTPFGKRSEKRQGGSAGGPGQPGPGSAGTSQGPQRSRGGQPGASAHARVARGPAWRCGRSGTSRRRSSASVWTAGGPTAATARRSATGSRSRSRRTCGGSGGHATGPRASARDGRGKRCRKCSRRWSRRCSAARAMA